MKDLQIKKGPLKVDDLIISKVNNHKMGAMTF